MLLLLDLLFCPLIIVHAKVLLFLLRVIDLVESASY